MSALLPDIDPDGLLEFSVVFTDRSLNHMSAAFGKVMRDISEMLKTAYNADAVALVPGGGTYAMEAVARQFAGDEKVMVIRNGWFSYRWSQIFEASGLPASDRYEGPADWERHDSPLCARADRGCGCPDYGGSARRCLCTSCGNQRRDDPAG